MNNIEKLAYEITKNFFSENYLEIVGAKVIGNDMYVKGFDSGFPHAVAYVQVDLNSKKIVNYYEPHNCPVNIIDGIFE